MGKSGRLSHSVCIADQVPAGVFLIFDRAYKTIKNRRWLLFSILKMKNSCSFQLGKCLDIDNTKHWFTYIQVIVSYIIVELALHCQCSLCYYLS